MKRLLVAGGLLVSLSLLGTEARAQTGTARGKVLDEKGQAVTDAKVLLEFMGGVTRKYETKTNKKGEFTQVGMPPGNYKVTITKEGFQGQALEHRIALGEPTYLPDVKLLTTAAAVAAGGADPAMEELKAAFKKAIELTQAGKLDEAEAAYKDVIAKNASIPEAHYNLGYVQSQKKDWTGAEASFQKALELRPEYGEASVALAKVYQDSGQPDKAMAQMSKAAEANTGDAKVQFNLGIFHLNAGKSEEASAAFQKALTIDPNMAEAHFHLGTLAVGQNDIPGAVEHLEKYLAANPQNAQNVATAQGLLQALKKK
jgi:tetratricopeptide (TPR) repeat protein